MSLTDTLKDHVVMVVAVTAIGSFGAGWGAYKSTVEAQDQELILKTRRVDLEQKAADLDSCRKASDAARAGGTSACPDKTVAVPERRPRFADGQWHYFAMPKASGVDVARRLTEIGPPQDSLVVSYDGSANNTFHIWYRGQGTSTRYTYESGEGTDLSEPPRTNTFLPEPGVVPAGIGGIGTTAVPIYFVATR